MTIWKFILKPTIFQTINMPAGAKILTVQNQCNDITLWAEVEEKAPIEKRFIEIFGTGSRFGSGSRTYIGTVLMLDDGLVWHVYEREAL
jgi:hypothetical protein